MAKDTEKLIRQLSLISFLMAQGRPVSAQEIKQEVEGYRSMNDDAFARRFYADRAELESLGIDLQVDKPGDGFFEAELYSLPPENYYLPAIEFSDDELGALRTALALLDGEFAYAEPLRLALQQVSWGRPNPLAGEQRTSSVTLSMTASAGGRELSQRLAKVETAISRRKTIEFTYYTMQSDSEAKRVVDPYHLVYRGGQFYLIGYAHEREGVRVFRLSRIRGKVSYATKAEHDFSPPEDFDRRDYALRAEWQMGEIGKTAKVFLRDRIAWLVERDYGSYGECRKARKADGAPGPGMVFETAYANPDLLVSWVLSWREHATILEPAELSGRVERARELLHKRHSGKFKVADPSSAAPAPRKAPARTNGRGETPIRPERFARLVTLAGTLIEAARVGKRLAVAEVCEGLKITRAELREDVDVLNIVNFGGGTYVLYAEIQGDEIEVDSEPYGDNFARPARLLPLEAKALVAAIDLLGDHLPQVGLGTARGKIVEALGHDPSREGLQIAPGGDDAEVARVVNTAISQRRILKLDYYKENEDAFTRREVEPYRLENGPEGWYVECWDPKRKAVRHFRLDRMRKATMTERSFEPRPEVEEAAGIEGWLTGGEVPSANVARVWVSSERARWEAEERDVAEELADGSVVVELPYAGSSWLIREILKGAGELVVLEPQEAREAILKEVSD